jgi:hypothetical protein
VRKKIFAKVYTADGIGNANYLGLWDDVIFHDVTKSVDGGMGECRILLPRKFDDYDEWGTVGLGNVVELVVSDDNEDSVSQTSLVLSGRRIYKGYIANYTPRMEGNDKGVEIILLGDVTRLSLEIYKNSTTTTITESAVAIETIFKNIITRYRAEVGTEIGYTSSSVGTSGQTGSYTFRALTYLDAIRKTRELAPANWHWYVDENGVIHFRSPDSTPTHVFVRGRHFTRIAASKNIETMRNVLYLYNGESGGSAIYKRYKNDTSVAKYGSRAEFVTDKRLGNSSTMDNYATRFLSERKDPQLEIEIEVVDQSLDPINGYDIESIQPLDTCRIVGFNFSQSETFVDNMLITKVVYRLGSATVTMESVKKALAEDVIRIKNNLQYEQTTSIPTTYTT